MKGTSFCKIYIYIDGVCLPKLRNKLGPQLPQLPKAGSVYTGLIHSESQLIGSFFLEPEIRIQTSINSVKQIQPIDGILVPTRHVHLYIYILVRADTGALTELEPRIFGIHPTNRCMSSCSGFTFSSGHVASTGSPSAGALQRISP